MKYVGILLLFFFLISCGDFEAISFDDVDSIREWVYFNIGYVDEIKDEWQTPEETYLIREGDCEDKALLMMWLIHRDLGGYPSLVKINADFGGYHAVVLYDGIMFDSAKEYDKPSVWTFGYNTAMALAAIR